VSNREPERMTASQKAALEAELAELEGPKRQAIIDAIAVARGFGDLSENFEYHAAKHEGGMLEGRILKLRERLSNVNIVDGEAAAASGKVEVGAHVVIEDEDGEQLTVEISAVSGTGAVSPTSPLGRALLGAKVGDVVKVEAPRRTWHATVVSFTYPGH
jgi:transcription elongation factor GreA